MTTNGNTKSERVAEDIRERALEMVARGYATISDAAELAGVSRQLMGFWVTRARIDAAAARAKFLKSAWGYVRLPP